MFRTFALACVLAFSSAAFAQTVELPPQCRSNGVAAVDWAACLRASPPGSQWRALPLINLGSEALAREDYATAVRYYDEAVPPGQTLTSDVVYHANRAYAYSHVGRTADALVDARIAYRMLNRDPSLPVPERIYMPAHVQRDMIYVSILSALKEGDAPELAPAMEQFMALPASDWISYVNRAAVLSQVENYDAALRMSARALELAPNEPAALNNHCYVLFKLGRAQEGLPHCEAAVARAPDAAIARHSLAEVLGALGRCADAEREIAAARRLDPSSAAAQEPIACVTH